jgi:putative DNA primase/helicase
MKFTKLASSSHGARAARELAQSEPAVALDSTAFDADPFLLNCTNGVLNILRGELLPHSPELMCTHMCGTEFDPKADCPRWRQFIREITMGSGEMANYLRRIAGLAITGAVEEHALWVFMGGGKNGKSTFLKHLSYMLGTYFAPAPVGLLVQTRNGIEDERAFASIAGKRLVTSIEVDAGSRLSEARVKLLTGGDPVQARRIHRSPWMVQPTWKLVMAANHLPRVSGTDSGIWRRLKQVPFTASFEGREDEKLDATLAEELPGILAWCVSGAITWRGQGTNAPECVAQATEAYRIESDVLGRWIEEACEVHPEVEAATATLYESYAAWAREKNENVWTETAFGNRLNELGFVKDGRRKTMPNNTRSYIRTGIALG